MTDKQLDISRVPVKDTRFVWLSYIVDSFDLLVISKEQSKEIFGGWYKPWKSYKGIPIKVK